MNTQEKNQEFELAEACDSMVRSAQNFKDTLLRVDNFTRSVEELAETMKKTRDILSDAGIIVVDSLAEQNREEVAECEQ